LPSGVWPRRVRPANVSPAVLNKAMLMISCKQSILTRSFAMPQDHGGCFSRSESTSSSATIWSFWVSSVPLATSVTFSSAIFHVAVPVLRISDGRAIVAEDPPPVKLKNLGSIRTKRRLFRGIRPEKSPLILLCNSSLNFPLKFSVNFSVRSCGRVWCFQCRKTTTARHPAQVISNSPFAFSV
jgi:hypothetical protein